MSTQMKCRFLITGAAALLLCIATCFDVLPRAIGFEDARKSYSEETLYQPVIVQLSTRNETAIGEPGTFEQAQAITQRWHRNNPEDSNHITNEKEVTVRTYQRHPSRPEDRNDAPLNKSNNPSLKANEPEKPTQAKLAAEKKELLKQKQELEDTSGNDIFKLRKLQIDAEQQGIKKDAAIHNQWKEHIEDLKTQIKSAEENGLGTKTLSNALEEAERKVEKQSRVLESRESIFAERLQKLTADRKRTEVGKTTDSTVLGLSERNAKRHANGNPEQPNESPTKNTEAKTRQRVSSASTPESSMPTRFSYSDLLGTGKWHGEW